jgi:nitric oxide reductase subunit B
MVYQSQRIAYAYFLAAVLLFGLQVAFGVVSLAKYLGPDPLLNVVNFATAKTMHTNLLLVWVLTGFMGTAYYMVPEESRTEIYSVPLAYVQLALWFALGVAAVVGYLCGWTEGRKLLEMPQPLKYGVVVVMLLFLGNIGLTIHRAGRWTTTQGILVGGLAAAALLFISGMIPFDNYTLDRFYRWWVVHLWVEGVWELILGAMLAFLLMRLSGADREVMDK